MHHTMIEFIRLILGISIFGIVSAYHQMVWIIGVRQFTHFFHFDSFFNVSNNTYCLLN